ncbi:ER degradation-enhancing alpha-mannosidase-like protein 2 [Ctenocephalides felis]|uniref:ER degradation-enhancing alpha-mannosidase-like protein 2 n=1 Tax=Ctenocephalides felis TaxID=7515 RepID=UPI000E6E3372|nr:ER degradation-enhancing alpha-mannosidase-like protein 2 [Ctenocephalides felis]
MVSLRVLVFLTMFTPIFSIRKYSKHDMLKLREEVRQMFQHAYNGYLKYASDYDELRPLTCDGVNTWGSYSLTLVDALDTLAVMGNYTEFRRAVDIIISKANFDTNINVSVFETNIRIVGGLISAHLMSFRAGIDIEPGWPCNGPLLRLAEDVARRLLPAFNTPTGMPYGTVNLRYGVPEGETSITCTAGVGTFIIEFGALSRLTGDPIYEEVALNALHSLYKHRSSIGLFGNHIDVLTGRWTAQDAGIGAGVDSYYEYLVKGAIMLQRPELMHMFNEGYKSINKYLRKDDWHIWASMNKGQVTLPVFQSLEAYWPGVLSLIGDTKNAMKTLHNYHSVWKQYGFTPELYNIAAGEAGTNRENYPLRPELIESVMYLYRATQDPYLLQVGEDILRSIQHSAKTSCGYATIKDVRNHQRENKMESFFLAETTKYLYLLFDTNNFIHSRGQHGQIIDTPNGKCIIDTGGYVFNTEAHPIDIAALHCCHEIPRQNLLSNLHEKIKMFRSIKSKVHDFTTDDHSKPQKLQSEGKILDIDITEISENELNENPNVMDNKFTNDTFSRNNTEGKYQTNESSSQGHLGEVIEIVKFSSDLDTNSEENDMLHTANDSTLREIKYKTDIDKNTAKVVDSFSDTTPVESLVKNLIKSALPKKLKFDPQDLLLMIKNNYHSRNITWENDYKLLTCKAQPFSQRISLLGEFYN